MTVTCVPPVKGAAATERSLVTEGPSSACTSTSAAAMVSSGVARSAAFAETVVALVVSTSADAATAPSALTPMIADAQPRATVRRNAAPVGRRLRRRSARWRGPDRFTGSCGSLRAATCGSSVRLRGRLLGRLPRALDRLREGLLDRLLDGVGGSASGAAVGSGSTAADSARVGRGILLRPWLRHPAPAASRPRHPARTGSTTRRRRPRRSRWGRRGRRGGAEGGAEAQGELRSVGGVGHGVCFRCRH